MTGADKSGSRRAPEPSDKCSEFVEKTPLSSPKPAILKKLEKGDVLDVVLQKHRDSPSTVVAAKDTEIAGSIISARSPQLIRCLERGFEFEAEIVQLEGGLCTVQVRAKS
jgi:hypothetical protein